MFVTPVEGRKNFQLHVTSRSKTELRNTLKDIQGPSEGAQLDPESNKQPDLLTFCPLLSFKKCLHCIMLFLFKRDIWNGSIIFNIYLLYSFSLISSMSMQVGHCIFITEIKIPGPNRISPQYQQNIQIKSTFAMVKHGRKLSLLLRTKP